MHTCRLIAQRFAGELELTEGDARVFILKACICGLLHDVGHGFCSHFFEDLLKSLGFEKRRWDHKIWTQEIIQNTQIKDLITTNSTFSIDEILAIFRKIPAKESEVFLSQIISSKLDADRLDYLDRDALYTGVRQRIDFPRIIYTLTPDRERGRVLVREKGMQAVEGFLVTRLHMHQNVYFHKAVRGIGILVEKMFRRAKDLVENGNQDIEKITNPTILKLPKKEKLTLEEYLVLDDYSLFSTIKSWAKSNDKILKDLATRFLDRKLFKVLRGTTERLEDPFDPIHKKIDKLFEEHNLSKDYYSKTDTPHVLAYMLLYDPTIGEEGEPGSENIFILKNNDETVEITKTSRVLDTLHDVEFEAKRFYVPECMRDEIEALL